MTGCGWRSRESPDEDILEWLREHFGFLRHATGSQTLTCTRIRCRLDKYADFSAPLRVLIQQLGWDPHMYISNIRR